MKYQAIIGLEIHMQLLSNSKLFSSAPANYMKVPNSQVASLDLAMPGAMPVVNKKCVISAIRMCHALNMEIARTLTFDRKNYFYSDLPKGYQLTQYFNPIGKNGYLEIKTFNGVRKINIHHLHLEEDACKQIHNQNETLLDYNRAGMGLIEIVTDPDMRNGEEAKLFLEEINAIAKKLEVTNGKLEEGTLRCDVNVSLKDLENNKDGVIVELKNLNGFKNVANAISAEINRQLTRLNEGKQIKAETRRYEEKSNKTIFMRPKNRKIDYKYFQDANIVPILLSEDFINDALLIKEKHDITLTDELVNRGVRYKTANNFVNSKLKSFKNKHQEIDIDINELANILIKVDKQKINMTQAYLIFEKVAIENLGVIEAIKALGYDDIYDDDKLLSIIEETLLECNQATNDYKNGKDKAFNYLLGRINQKTQGKVNQLKIKTILLAKLGGK